MYRFNIKKGQRLYYNYKGTTDELNDLKRLKNTTYFEDKEEIIIYKMVNGASGSNARSVSPVNNILPTAYSVEEELADGVYEVVWEKLLLEKVDTFALKILLALIPALLIYGIIDAVRLSDDIETFIMIFLYVEWYLLISVAIFTPFRIVWGFVFALTKKKYKKPKIKKISKFKKIENFNKYIKEDFYNKTGQELCNDKLLEKFFFKKKVNKKYIEFIMQYDFIDLDNMISSAHIGGKECKINIEQFYGFFSTPQTIVEVNEEFKDFLEEGEMIIATGDGKFIINIIGEIYFWDNLNLFGEVNVKFKLSETFNDFLKTLQKYNLEK